jgi:hypothetical protein
MKVMRRQLVAVIAMLWVTNLVAAAALQCAGWQSTPAARVAACKMAGHRCPHQQQHTVDRCCAQSEQSRQTAASTAVAPLVKPTVSFTALLDLAAAMELQSAHATAIARSFEAHTLTLPHESPHLVFSVFRI